jgi:HlyD family secretion protein
MADPDKKLFRKEALERFSSPDNLEQLMPVAGAKDWLLIVVAGTLLVLVGVWCVLGRVPTIATGRGVILRPRQLTQAQASAAGRILSLHVRTGDRLKEGDLIATIDQSDILKRIDENRRGVEILEEQDRRKREAESSQLALQAQQDAMERSGLEAQRINLKQSLSDANLLKPVLEARAEAIRRLVKEGLLGSAAQEVSDVQSAARDNDAKIYDYTARLSQIDGQLEQIETRRAALAKQILADSTARRNEIGNLHKTIDLDSFQIVRDGNICSQSSGRVAEVMAAVGQVVPAGGKLLTLEADDPADSQPGAGLISISYYPVKDGKQIQPGMRIQITPDTVERERFGGIDGTVISVSPIPVTKEGAIGTIGNTEVVENLMPDGVYIEVQARLERDPATASGYRWSSSKGPDIRITSGLTNSARVTIEGRAPVTYLLPILREASGVY